MFEICERTDRQTDRHIQINISHKRLAEKTGSKMIDFERENKTLIDQLRTASCDEVQVKIKFSGTRCPVLCPELIPVYRQSARR